MKKNQIELIKNINFFDNKNNIKNILKIQEFEKDDDKNGHLDFIHAASNLRAKIYQINNCEKIDTKLISGKITPAIASTTAAIVGLVSLQLFTLLQTNNINFLRNSYINLSLNSISFCCPSKFEEENNNESMKDIHKGKSILDFILNFSKQYLKNLIIKHQ